MKNDVSESKPGRSGRRNGGVILLAGAVALLFAGILGFDRAGRALPRAEQDLARAEAALNDARTRERLAQQNQILLGSARALQQRAQGMGVLPQGWGERQINLRQQHLKREEINQLLLTTAQGKGQLFHPEEFELSVTKSDEGLFDIPENPNHPVLLSLRGTVYFRIAERPL